MDYIQNLVVHSRGVYNVMGISLEAHVSLLLLFLWLLYILFKNHFQMSAIFKPFCGGRDLHRESTKCK